MNINVVPLNCGNCQAPLIVKTHLQPFVKCEHCDTMNAVVWDDNGSASIKMSIIGVVFNRSVQDVLEIVKNVLLRNPCPPLDLFSGTEVTDIKRILVPVYWVDDCIGVGHIMYEKAYTVQRIRGTGDKQEVVDETEWRTENTEFSETKDFIISANREYNEVIQNLYRNRNLAANNDIKNIDMKSVSEVADRDVLENNIFSGFIKPEMESYIRKKAFASFSKTKKVFGREIDVSGIQNIKVNGIDVSKGKIQRLWVEICEVVYNYKGNDYKIYISDNGEDIYYSEIPSIDEGRQQKLDSLRDKRKSLETQALLLMLGIVGIGILGFYMSVGLIIVGGTLISDNISEIGAWLGGICSIIGGGVTLPLAWIGIKKVRSIRREKMDFANAVGRELDDMENETMHMDKELKLSSSVKNKCNL